MMLPATWTSCTDRTRASFSVIGGPNCALGSFSRPNLSYAHRGCGAGGAFNVNRATMEVSAIWVELPVDIIRLVLKEGARISQGNASILMLVSKAAKAWVQPVMYSQPIVLWSREQAVSFVRSMSSPLDTMPSPARLVTAIWLLWFDPQGELRFGNGLDALPMIRLKLCPNLTHLACTANLLASDMSPYEHKRLEKLSILSRKDRPMSQLCLPICPSRITKLHLVDMTVEQLKFYGSHGPRFSDILMSVCIEHIAVGMNDRQAASSCGQFLESAMIGWRFQGRFSFKFDESIAVNAEKRLLVVRNFLASQGKHLANVVRTRRILEPDIDTDRERRWFRKAEIGLREIALEWEREENSTADLEID